LESQAKGKLPEKSIIRFCKERLAHIKIPQVIIFMDELPRTPVGKIDRKNLIEVS
jgi:acyl-CoA synthetase (AMP-forming)/AMP-acid ligase II